MDDVTAVLDAPESTVETNETQESTAQGDQAQRTQEDKQDGRKQPDALKKHVADLRRRAETIIDPVEKKAELDRIKFLYDISGKARGYEEVIPTVREAREVKALLDSVGGREGVQKMQATLSRVEAIDQALSAGDVSAVDKMWEEAPEGMPKLVPAILDRFERDKPQDYEKFIAPKSISYLDKSGFPQAFDRMVKLYEAGKTDDAKALRDELIGWVVSNRAQAQQERHIDPEVERLRSELAKRDKGVESQKIDGAYNAVVAHAGPALDKVLKPLAAELKLSPEGYADLRRDVWNHLQESRNNNDVYKTVAPSKQKQGYDVWTEYAKKWTEDNADASSRAVIKAWKARHQQGTQTTSVTRQPGTPTTAQGKEPQPSEIDYSGRGRQMLVKAGLWKPTYKDMGDAILDGIAPLKAGGIRKWR